MLTFLLSTPYKRKGKCLGCFEKKRKKQGNKPSGKTPIALNATRVAQGAVHTAQASGNADKASDKIESASAEIEADSIKLEGPSDRIEGPSISEKSMVRGLSSAHASWLSARLRREPKAGGGRRCRYFLDSTRLSHLQGCPRQTGGRTTP